MIEFSSVMKLNEIHIVDSPFNEDPKNMMCFSRNALISEEGRPENSGKCLLLCKSGSGQFHKGISVPTPWYQNSCDASILLHARPNFRKK